MKTNPTSLLRVVVVLAMLGSHAAAQQHSEQKSEQRIEQGSAQASSSSSSKVTIEVNGKRVEADGNGGTITIRTDGDKVEIDTDGDGKPEEQIDRGEAEEKPVAWLGVKTNDVSPELASQLDIDGGAVVEMVVPDSPADKAGLQEHDIITAIGETGVSTPTELAAAIRDLDPGSKTSITALRRAKPVELEATLGERPQMPKRIPEFDEMRDFNIQGKNADEVRKRLEEMLKGMNLDLGGANLPDLKFPEQGADIVRMSSKTTSFSDGNGSITITTKDGETQIVAKDAEGKLLYEGPAETDEDRKKLPPEVLEKLERFESMNVDLDIKGFKHKMLPPAFELPELMQPKRPAKPKRSTHSKPSAITAA